MHLRTDMSGFTFPIILLNKLSFIVLATVTKFYAGYEFKAVQ